MAGLSAAGVAPDLHYVQPASSAPLSPIWDIQTMVLRRLLAPLEQHIASEGQRLRLPDFLPGALEATRWHGALYGLPTSARPLLVAYDPAQFAATAVASPEAQPGGLTWQWVRDSVPRLVREEDASGSPRRRGLLAAPQGVLLGQLLLASGVALWNATGTAPRLDESAALEILRFWKALREPANGTLPVPGSFVEARWQADGIFVGGTRIAMGFTSDPPSGRGSAAGDGVSVLHLTAAPRAARHGTPLQVDGFVAVPAAAPDPRRSTQALAGLLDALLPHLPWQTRDAGPQTLMTGMAMRSVEEARQVLEIRRSGQAVPLHASSALSVLHAELAVPIETGRRTVEEALTAGIAALARELDALNGAAIASAPTGPPGARERRP